MPRASLRRPGRTIGPARVSARHARGGPRGPPERAEGAPKRAAPAEPTRLDGLGLAN
jgi:hypothetical protein